MRKSQSSLLLIITIAVASILIVSINSEIVSAATSVSGVITTDTTWTQTNSPYTLTGNVLVNSGITLTVESGVTINLNSYYLMVNGTLQAVGNSTNPVVFNNGQVRLIGNSWDASTGKGSIIQNSIVNCVLTINTAPKIDSNTITGAVDGDGNAIISNNVITGGLKVSGGTITNNTIMNQGINVKGVATVFGNNISNVPSNALTIWNSATVSNNIITSSNTGLWVYTQDVICPIANIQNNLIVNNTYGVQIVAWLQATANSPILKNNTISNNTYGIYLTPYPGLSAGQSFPVIVGNNIFGNTNNAVTTESQNINATGNWWGTTDTQAIDQKISDYNDDFTIGRIVYLPILSAPNNQAPTFIVASVDANGLITPSGIIGVNYGSNQTFSISANSGYEINDVLVNGTSIGKVNSYTAQNIQGATTITAQFKATPTPSPSPSPSPTAAPTTNPTQLPTNNPTTNPTISPTQQPTVNPTTAPTQAPSIAPTPSPTVPELHSVLALLALMIALGLAASLLKKQKNDLSSKKGIDW